VSASATPELAQRVSDAYAVHLERRDQLTAMVREDGGEPVAADVSYQLPSKGTGTVQLTASALEIERRAAEVYAQMVGSTARAERQWAMEALDDAAVRQLDFGGAPEAFPGLPEL